MVDIEHIHPDKNCPIQMALDQANTIETIRTLQKQYGYTAVMRAYDVLNPMAWLIGDPVPIKLTDE